MDSQPDFRLISNIMKWRYLDSLDSTRYSPRQYIDVGASVPHRTEQAEIELIVTMLMGNGIVVPNNQLMDSFGFIHLASSMIETANKFKKDKKEIFVPIRWAKFDYGIKSGVEDTYDLVAMLFNRDGKEGRKLFELSAWQSLANDRVEFAEYLRNHKIPKNDFFKSDYDESLAAELYTILRFFSSNKETHIDDAASTHNDRNELFDSISGLSTKDIEKDPFFVKMSENDNSAILDQKKESIISIINVFNRLKDNIDSSNRSDRTVIRQALINKPELFLSNLPVLPITIRKGVIQTIDTLYNFSSFITTKAEQDHQTEPMEKDSIWGVDEAAFALGQWARNQFNKKRKGIQSTHDISSTQDTFIAPRITAFTDPQKISIWDKFFYSQRENTWITSITDYMTSLREFENAKKDFLDFGNPNNKDKYFSQLNRYLDRYQMRRRSHIEKVNSLLGMSNNYKVVESDDKAFLLFLDINGEVESKIQIEDFSENSLLNCEEISALYSGQVADENTTNKGFTGEYGNN